VGKRADFLLIDRDRPQFIASHDPYSTLVYAARGTDVRTTVVDGEILVDEFRPTRWDPADIATAARTEAGRLAARAGF
jgi:5-methylthioadenosine/S-adenosylhomocysteine deaminase